MCCSIGVRLGTCRCFAVDGDEYRDAGEVQLGGDAGTPVGPKQPSTCLAKLITSRSLLAATSSTQPQHPPLVQRAYLHHERLCGCHGVSVNTRKPILGRCRLLGAAASTVIATLRTPSHAPSQAAADTLWPDTATPWDSSGQLRTSAESLHSQGGTSGLILLPRPPQRTYIASCRIASLRGLSFCTASEALDV